MSDLAVIFGGPSPEHDVSVLTGLQAVRTLSSSGAGALRAVYWTKSGDLYGVDAGLEGGDFLAGVPRGSEPLALVPGAEGGFARRGRLGSLRALPVDVVVNCCHGGPGEDGRLQSVLDLAGIDYTGPDAQGASLGMDKLAFGALVEAAGLPTLPRCSLGREPRLRGPGPYIVKPRFGGSSIGIEVVEDAHTAEALARSSVHLSSGAVAEPYRPELFDLQVAARAWPELQLSAIERPLRSAPGEGILAYSDKYVGGEGMSSAPRELPADIPEKLEARLREIARETAVLARLRGMARLDFLSDGQELYLNEINTIPGSLAKYLWTDPPLEFSQLLSDMMDEARARPTARFDSSGADGSVLRSAGSIASKLG